ncbi:citrate lyase subunit beta/citryl-CoA lyase [Amycolatopsis bartoniae]|uniref:CoA ester lyase n=1 Tax=Amycolatopsis bartoniae TaxID=941986 RepID=A0A8H9MCA7_9PSEU|nr:CoA ester lyase [Amycolatopsis bartoniae]MBB2937969.1 citrate lyase subunit beta/citryl-CoA lyase [Amycolatopsis bartoniae]TVT08544.1 CoA ester lyase [Amycolatopsis bartoniae]GHF42036.1 CoA ester lyase [Amycolatopsis bartoniae]
MTAQARSWLYVPAHRADVLLPKAMAGVADAVVLDLEDAVPATAKDAARAAAVAAAAVEQPKPLWVRVNALGSEWGRADLAALAGSRAAGLRLPKVEDPATVREAAERTGLPLHVVLESALGVERAYELATAHPLVALLSLGEADLMADLRVSDRDALDWARQRVVVAARAAGLPSPPHAAWTAVSDVDGLVADTTTASRRGFFGRSVLHPSQLEPVNRLFTPGAAEVARARALLKSLADRSAQDVAAWLDEDGRFVDAAVVANARWLVELADTISHERTSS